jgi:hypothetical protein
MRTSIAESSPVGPRAARRLTELRARLGENRKSSSRVRRIFAGLPQAIEATAA